MAKIFDKNQISSNMNDDIIKEALKTGLSSIRPSDELVEKTLAQCRNEILNQNNKKIRFTPLIYRLGASIAACAAVLVLALNLGMPLMDSSSKQSTASAAESSSRAIEEEVQNEVNISSALPEESQDYSIAGAGEMPAETPAPAPSEKNDSLNDRGRTFAFGESLDGKLALTFTEGMNTLYSSAYRSNKIEIADREAYIEAFKYIVEQYNERNGTSFNLVSEDIIPIHSLPDSGVDAKMLIDAKSYRDIISGEGYWALPLVTSEGKYEGFLSTVAIEDEPKVVVPSNATIVEFEGSKFLVSAKDASSSDNDVSLFESMFEGEEIVALVEETGYGSVSSEPVFADINRGTDYLAFIEADGKELAVPFISSGAFPTVESKKIYTLSELFEIIRGYLK
ncbi:MAG: hypothetical protein GXX10_02325 [Clostridiaceae bacterium]|nr:hypothetical protein [Clostridiaceae bacterium]